MKHVMMTFALIGTTMAFASAASAQDAAAKGQEMFAKADANHDGAISAEEWKAAGRRDRGFQMVDADHDGKITPEELRAAAAKRGQ